MAVTSTASLFQYAIVSLGQAFSPPVSIQNASDLVATFTDATTLIDTVLTLNVDYTVGGTFTNSVNTAPTVTLEAAGLHYVVGGTLTIQRASPLTQPTTFIDGVKYQAATTNNALDWLCYALQELKDLLNRCLCVPATSSVQSPIALATRKSQLIGFDANGNFTTFNPASLGGATLIAGTNGQITAATSGGTVTIALATITTIANLKALTGMTNNQWFNVLGYFTPGDGGGGLFYFNSGSAATDNGGTILSPNAGSGRFMRYWSGAMQVSWFGPKADWNGTTGTNDAAVIQAAINAALAKVSSANGTTFKPALEFGPGQSYFLGNSDKALVFSAPIIINGNGSAFYHSGTGTNRAFYVSGEDVIINNLYIINPLFVVANRAALNISSLTGIALQTDSTNFFRYENVYILGFAYGMDFFGRAAIGACSYGETKGCQIRDCTYGVRFRIDTHGVCTHIRFFGGTVTFGPFLSMTGSRGISIEQLSDHEIDGIVFYSTTTEGSPIRKLYCNGNDCGFHDVYWDASNGGTDIEFPSTAKNNIVSSGANLETMVILDSNGKNTFIIPGVILTQYGTINGIGDNSGSLTQKIIYAQRASGNPAGIYFNDNNIQKVDGSNNPAAIAINSNGGETQIGKTGTGVSVLMIKGLPTSSAGLTTGQVWNNSGVLTIV